MSVSNPTRIFLLSLFFFSFSVAGFGGADYETRERGWHKGFYTTLGVGFLNIDADTNVLTNRAFGSDILLGYGVTFGWNFLDYLAAELQGRYATEKANNQREHAANININIKYSLLLDALTSSSLIRFLPYLKVGGGIFGAALPDTSAGNNRFGVYGPTFILGGGMEVLISKIYYVGLDFTQDFAFLQAKNNSAGQRILNGGLDPQSSLFGYFGLHF